MKSIIFSIQIDIEGSSPNPNGESLPDNKKHARAQHNALERRRRDNIKDMYGSLKNEIDNFNHERASRAQILCKTIEQMEVLQNEVDEAEKDAQEAEEENARLQKELEELEAAEGWLIRIFHALFIIKFQLAVVPHPKESWKLMQLKLLT